MPTDTQSPRRVLFVDDDPQFLEATRELMGVFSDGQWVITTADSASAAFAVLQDHPVDLAVIDVQMGVMDGIQMLSLLNRGYPNVQKVVLTGFANENYRAACLSNGAELFLEKPTTQEGWQSLFTALDELLKYKPEEGFRGVLRRIGLQDVLQMECLARSSSVLEISNGPMEGSIFVEEGHIIHAQIGDLTGEDAFNHLLSLGGGQFNLKPFTEPSARTLKGPWESLLMEAARRREEALSAPAASALPGETAAAVVGDDLVIIDAETGEPISTDLFTAAAPETAAAPVVPPPEPTTLRPRVEELLICSAHGEVLHQWQCRNVDVWVNFFEFISQRAQRLAQALPLGEFDRLEIHSADSRAVVIIGVDRGVLVKTAKEPVLKQNLAGGDGAMPMSEEVKQQITDWLRRTPSVRGVLVRGIRFADQTFVCDFDSRDFPMGALEQAWRSVADAFEVLTAQRLPPTRLTWVYERSVLHCVRRDDGSVLGVFVAKKQIEPNPEGVDRLLSEFKSLGVTSD